MKLLCIALCAAFPSVTVAQETNTYAGYFSGNCQGMRGQPVEASVVGQAINGTYKNASGSVSKFEGVMQGNKFNIKVARQRGEEALIVGTVDGDKMKLSHEQRSCRFTADMVRK